MSSTPFRQRLALQILAKQNQLKRAGAKGFTLIELLVVIVILGVLGAVGYQAYLNQTLRAYASQAANTATAMAKNCAALQITGDEGDWATLTADSFDAAQVTQTGTCNATGTPSAITVEVGNASTSRTAVASVTAEGVVTPAAVPTA